MEEGVVCPKCLKRNDIHKFCIYCGHQLYYDDQLRLILENSEPYCLNCGRKVKKGQEECECGYEFRDIKCPKCNSKNAYTNRFCTECGKKLWTPIVVEETKKHRKLLDIFQKKSHNTISHQRYKFASEIYFPGDLRKIGKTDKELRLNVSRINDNLNEILARWKIVSPNWCINCSSILKSNKFKCKKCSTSLIDGKDRVKRLKNKKYIKPVFGISNFRWNSKFDKNYLNSLAPDIGESQFEYRERLKCEYLENNSLKDNIKFELRRIQENEERLKREKELNEIFEQARKENEERAIRRKEYIRKYGGGFCDSRCKYYYSELINSSGAATADHVDVIGEFHHCRLGHSVDFGSWCKDYE